MPHFIFPAYVPSLPQFPLPDLDDDLVSDMTFSFDKLDQSESNADTTSESGTDTTSSTSSPPPGDGPNLAESSRKKKRKPTYYVRKEETEALKQEIEELQARLRELETKPNKDDVELTGGLAVNSLLRADIRQNALRLAGAQSMLSGHLASTESNPLTTYIHLTKDPEQRRQVLSSLLDFKFREAIEFNLERTRFLDLRREHRQCDRFETSNGDYVLVQCDVTPFYGVESVKRVYDELLFFVANQEISISENLGITTITETDSCGDATVSQCRLLSTVCDGLHVETNAVMFQKYLEPTDQHDSPIGIVLADFVDQDDLQPYLPKERLRQDITAISMISQCPPTAESSTPVVTMTRWAFTRLHKAQCGISRDMELFVRQRLVGWGDIMVKVMTERLLTPPTPIVSPAN